MVPVVPVVPVVPEVPEVAEVAAAQQRPTLAEPSAAAVPLPDLPPDLQGPARVQLGFRDGTTALLDPDSEQAHALEKLAGLLTLREIPHR